MEINYKITVLVGVLMLTGLAAWKFAPQNVNKTEDRISKSEIKTNLKKNEFVLKKNSDVNYSSKNDNKEILNDDSRLRMRFGYENAKSYREFIYEALKNPGSGGYYYSLKALALCQNIQHISEKKTNSTVQNEALEKLNQKCDISKEESNTIKMQMMYSQTNQADSISTDPLIEMTRTISSTKNGSQDDAVVKAVLESNDFNIIGLLITPMDNEFNLSHEVYFDKQQYKSNSEVAILHYALDLAYCAAQNFCSANSAYVLNLCATNGWCEQSVDASIINGTKSLYDSKIDVKLLAQKIETAIKTKDSRSFISKEKL